MAESVKEASLCEIHHPTAPGLSLSTTCKAKIAKKRLLFLEVLRTPTLVGHCNKERETLGPTKGRVTHGSHHLKYQFVQLRNEIT